MTVKNEAKEVVVIGAGVIGICSAYFLWKKGYRVTVLEQDRIGNGASGRNAGLIVPSHVIPLASSGAIAQGLRWMFRPDSPFYIRPRFSLQLLSWIWNFRKACRRDQVHSAIPLLADLTQKSLPVFDEFASLKGVDFEWQHNGLLMLYRTEKGRVSNSYQAEMARKHGLDVGELTADELRRLYPGINNQVKGAFFYQQDGMVRPELLVGRLASYLEKKGVVIHTGVQATELVPDKHTLPDRNNSANTPSGKGDGHNTFSEPDADSVSYDRLRRIKAVRTTEGDLTADYFVLANGAWAPQLTRKLGLKMPVEPAKGYSITIPGYNESAGRVSTLKSGQGTNRNPFDGLPAVPMMLTEDKVTLSPHRDILRIAGTLELSGFDMTVNRKRLQGIVDSLPGYLTDYKVPSFDAKDVWVGHRPCSPDGLPYLGTAESAGIENLVISTGHAMIGMSLAPVTGKIVSELVSGEPPSADLTLLKVNRFG